MKAELRSCGVADGGGEDDGGEEVQPATSGSEGLYYTVGDKWGSTVYAPTHPPSESDHQHIATR
jgi:hypothetical protein